MASALKAMRTIPNTVIADTNPSVADPERNQFARWSELAARRDAEARQIVPR